MKLAAAALVVVALLAGCGDGDSQPSVESCNTVITDPNATPDITPLESGDYTLEFETTKGNFTVDIDEKLSPCNGDSMLQLAKAGFFDAIPFHRIVPGFVIQAGQSTKTTDGGPGYTTVDTPSPDTRYSKGVVAMAKTEADPPGTGSSQFFVVTGDDVTLPPDYAPIGKVAEGMDVVERIDKLGDLATQKPTEKVVIEHAKASGL